MRAAFAVTEQAVSLFRPLPSLVAIHGVIAAYHRRDAPHTVLIHSFEKLCNVTRSGIGRGVAAI